MHEKDTDQVDLRFDDVTLGGSSLQRCVGKTMKTNTIDGTQSTSTTKFVNTHTEKVIHRSNGQVTAGLCIL